jgi:hypothetical protein
MRGFEEVEDSFDSLHGGWKLTLKMPQNIGFFNQLATSTLAFRSIEHGVALRTKYLGENHAPHIPTK